MRILFLTHYFPPEGNAPAARTWDHCVRWAREGHDVTVITCIPNLPDGEAYDGFQSTWRNQQEVIEDVTVIRVWSWLAPNRGVFRRSCHYASYVFSAVRTGLFLKRPDVVIATSPHLLCGYAGLFLHWLRRVPFVLEIRDLWPESIAVVGAMQRGCLYRVLELMEVRLYKSATHIVTVTDAMRDEIAAKAPVAQRLSVVPNGVDLDMFAPADSTLNRQSTPENPRQFVLAYIGTVGLAHGLEIVVESVDILRQRGRDDIRVLIVGDGAVRHDLEQMVQERGLADRIRFTGRVDRQEVPQIMATSDAMLIHLLRDDLFRTVVPSKVFEAMAMNRPVLMGVPGESSDLIERSQAGLFFESGSAESLVEQLLRLVDDSSLYARLSNGFARQSIAQSYNRDRLAEQLWQILKNVANEVGPASAEGGLASREEEPAC